MSVPDDISTRVLSEIRRRRKEFAPRCIANPRDFWRVCSLLCSCVETFTVGAPAYDVASDCFCSWAVALRMRAQSLDQKIGNMTNQDALQRYFSDFALPHILELVKMSPDKRPDLLRITYSFSVPSVNAHKTLIRLVQQRLGRLGAVAAKDHHSEGDAAVVTAGAWRRRGEGRAARQALLQRRASFRWDVEPRQWHKARTALARRRSR